MPSMRALINLCESKIEIISPEDDKDHVPFWLPDVVVDPKNDRSWEKHEDADCMDVRDYGEHVDYATFEAFIHRNKNELYINGSSTGTDSIGVSNRSMVWKDKNKIERALYSDGYHDTECIVDLKWEKMIDAEPNHMIANRRLISN